MIEEREDTFTQIDLSDFYLPPAIKKKPKQVPLVILLSLSCHRLTEEEQRDEYRHRRVANLENLPCATQHPLSVSHEAAIVHCLMWRTAPP